MTASQAMTDLLHQEGVALETLQQTRQTLTERDTPQQRRALIKAEQAYDKAWQAREAQEETICQQFHLFYWWAPDAPGITPDTAWTLFYPQLQPSSVTVLDPPRSRQHSGGTKTTRDGTLLLEVDTKAPIEHTLEAVKRMLHFHRRALKPATTRQHPDKDIEALVIYDYYCEHPSFAAVMKQFKLPKSTVQSRFLRGRYLVDGDAPTGPMKHRRAQVLKNPEAEFQLHLGTCSRCQKAQTAEALCPKFLAYVDKDTKA
ncbi:MAG: hypothetical protein GKS05_02330 [Nitrospirales bacterium]|nr:hypothetical protein [Nitrospirales bacterium]